MKRILSLLIALLLILSLFACGKESFRPQGSWQGSIDISSGLAQAAAAAARRSLEEMGLDGSLAQAPETQALAIAYSLSISPDKSYTASAELEEYFHFLNLITQDIYSQCARHSAAALYDALVKYGMSPADQSLEALEEALGISLEEAMTAMMGLELRAAIELILKEELSRLGIGENTLRSLNSQGSFQQEDNELSLLSGDAVYAAGSLKSESRLDLKLSEFSLSLYKAQ